MSNKTDKETVEGMRKEKELSKQLKLLKDNNDKPDLPYRVKKSPYKKMKKI